MPDLENLVKMLAELSNEDKEVLKQALGVNEPKPKTPRKKRNTTSKKTEKKYNNSRVQVLTAEELDDDPEVRRATEISKKITKTIPTRTEKKRSPTKMVKVECNNCGRIHTISFDLARDFVCCFKQKKSSSRIINENPQ